MNSAVRRERIEKLLYELKYEITRGILEDEIDEELGFTFVVPRSRKLPKGVVFCSFTTRPTLSHNISPDELRLKVVK